MSRFYHRIALSSSSSSQLLGEHCPAGVSAPVAAVVPSIEPPVQRDHRLLVVYAIARMDRYQHLDTQLQHYVALCESGFEIHVVLATYPGGQWGSYFKTSRLFCFRTMQRISVTEINYGFAPEGNLPARHRRIFLHFNGSYDYYLIQEDDVILKSHNFHYYLKWMDAFETKKSMNLLPGFVDAEVFWHQGGMVKNISIPVVEFPSARILLFESEPLIIFSKTLQRLYILTQSQLTRFSRTEEWIGDLRRPYFEENVHMQARWLSRYFRFAIPLRDFYSALIHHSSDRFINEKSRDGTFTRTPNRNYAVHPVEFVELIRVLLGERYTVNHRRPWTLSISSSRDYSFCLREGKVLDIPASSVQYMGNFPLDVPNASFIKVAELPCICSVPEQDLERCNKDANVCHPTVYDGRNRIHVSIDLPCVSNKIPGVGNVDSTTRGYFESFIYIQSAFHYALILSIVFFVMILIKSRITIAQARIP